MDTQEAASGLPQTYQAANELEALGLRVVRAFNERDWRAGLTLAHPDIVAYPSRVHGTAGGYRGHDGLRDWFRTLAERGSPFELTVASMHRVERRSEDRRGARADRQGPRQADEHRGDDRRQIAASKLAIFGALCMDGEPLNPWAAVLIVQDGLIIRQRSYLSTRDLLEEIGIVAEPIRLTRPGS